MRIARINRQTAETKIDLSLNLDGIGTANVDTGCGFLDHMLTLFAKHSRFDLRVKCEGDTQVDYHHTVEDIAIVLGQALTEALGDKKGIERYGYMILPMDESLILSSVDLSGRAYLNCDLKIPSYKVGDFDTELVEEFFAAFVRTSACNLHIKQLEGKNSHHIIEGTFKSVARSLAAAVKVNEAYKDEIPSTKGVL